MLLLIKYYHNKKLFATNMQNLIAETTRYVATNVLLF